jgi:hypothetical protein
MQNPVAQISTADLEHVTGGTAPATPTTGTACGTNDALLAAIQGIQSSLKDLGNNQNQGLFGGNNGLLFMTMALCMQQRRNEVVVYGGPGRCGGGWSWRSWY